MIMGLFSKRQKIKIQTVQKDGYSGWLKCTHCNELIHAYELQSNQSCCPKCNYHCKLFALARIEMVADKDSFKELFTNISSVDPLGFVDTKSYTSRLEEAKKKTERDEAVAVGVCTVNTIPLALGVMDFGFMGGSMGSVVGEKLTLLIEHAIQENLPVVIICSSGGARMQESVLSLMQMAKTSAALAKLDEVGLPYISILTNPTTGGVTASFASLGDVIIAEPEAEIGFAGARVVEQTIRQKLPPGAQRSEFLLEKGMVDCIVNRHQLKDKLALILSFLTGNERSFENVSRQDPQKLRQLLALRLPS